jgi:hypothetical protein
MKPAIVPGADLDEKISSELAGFLGQGPPRDRRPRGLLGRTGGGVARADPGPRVEPGQGRAHRRSRRRLTRCQLIAAGGTGAGCRHGSAVHQTYNAIGRELCRNGRIVRYANDDGFGAPETAFLVYNFWYVDALAVIGRRDEARVLFIDLLAHRNAFGLLSEDIHPEARALSGNIPQTHSTAGTVNSAMRLSVRWEDVWCLVSS